MVNRFRKSYGLSLKIQICVDFDPLNFILLQTNQISLSQPPFPKQSREYVKQNGIPVIVQFIYGSSMSNTIELGQPNSFVALVPVYVRGKAYLALGDGNEAVAEFQKFVDHRGLVGNFSWGALARLGLARAYALQVQSAQGTGANAGRAKARAAYQDFLTIWKDADPDIPILKEAKAEYAKLQ
jgi:hypothetical protein